MPDRKIRLLIANTIEACVPAVKGGAFATRVNNLINCNEIKDRLDITVLSLYDEKAEEESRQYLRSKFIYVKADVEKDDNYRKSKWIKLLNKISFKIFHIILIPAPRIRTAYKKIKRMKFDYVLGAGGDPASYGWFTRKMGRERMLFNVGGHLEGGKVAANTFGNFICCSDYIKNYMCKDIESCNIITILNRIDTKKFMQEFSCDEKNELQKQLGTLGKTVIIFMGRIAPEKGVEQLIDAFNQMKYGDDCVLLIAGAANFGIGGETEFEKRIHEKVERSGDSIKLLGFIHHNELWKYMKISDMAVLPSMWEEPAGNVVPECMAAGLPIIITNSGGMVEYVDSDNAIVIDKKNDVVEHLKEAMEWLYENPDTRKEMGKKAQEKSKKFDIMVYYNMLCDELYRLQKEN